jgi:hypothetical protein
MSVDLEAHPDCAGHPGFPGRDLCRSCGRWACAVCAIELGRGVLCPSCSLDQIPWERRDQLGFGRAYWATLGPALFDSERFFARLRGSTSLRGPFSYALVSHYIGASTLCVIYGAAALEGRVPNLPRTAPAALLTAVVLLFLLSGPVVVLSQVALALVTHALLKFLGATKGFRTTLRAVLYGGGATALNATLIGALLLIPQVWALLGTISAVKQAHQTTFWKASSSVMIPTLAGWFLLFLVTAGAVQGSLRGGP